MKKNSVLKAILLVILAVVVCTWIFPSISFNGELVQDKKLQVGIFDLFSYSIDVLRYFPYVTLMVLAIGVFYGVAYRIPAYRDLLDKIVDGFKGKEKVFLASIIVLISAITSVTGLSFAMLFVFPFVISVILLMGYNKLVAASATVGSVVVGLIGTTLGSTSVDYINYILQAEVTDQMVAKVVLLVLGMVLLIFNVLRYATMTKNDTDRVLEFVPTATKNASVKEEKEEEKEEKKEVKKAVKKKAPAKKSKKTKANDDKKQNVKVVKNNSKSNIWIFAIVFDLVLILLALGAFNWETVAKTSWPVDWLKNVRNFKIDGFPIFDKILGSSFNAFGSWSLNVEMPAIIILASMVLAFVYGLKFDKYLEGALDGMKKASKSLFYMLLVYLVLIIVTYHPFQLHITKFFLDMSNGLNVITMTVTAMFASLFNVESIYAAQSTLPYVTTVVTNASQYPIVAVIFQAVYGLTMLIAPTSVILVGVLTFLDIPYTQWLKHIWKLFLELLIVLLIVFFILVLI